MSRQEDEKIIKNDLLQLLLTIPGERVYEPNFGVNLRSMVFSPLEESTVQVIKQEIYDKVTVYEPRVIITALDVKTNDPGNAILVILVAALKNDPATLIKLEYQVGGNTDV
jgi:phage baseplate assembly protein W